MTPAGTEVLAAVSRIGTSPHVTNMPTASQPPLCCARQPGPSGRRSHDVSPRL